MPVSKDVARYIRVCEMRPDAENDAVFTCCASSSTVVCDVNRVGLFLHAEEVHRGIDKLKIHLANKSAEAVRKAHLWKDWPPHLMKLDDFKSTKGNGVGDFADAPKRLGGLPPRKRRRRQAKIPSFANVEIIDDDIDEEQPGDDADPSSERAQPSDAHAVEAAGKQAEKNNAKVTKNKLLKSFHKKAADAVDKVEKKNKTILVPWVKLFG